MLLQINAAIIISKVTYVAYYLEYFHWSYVKKRHGKCK